MLQVEYNVQWAQTDENPKITTSWEPEENLTDCSDVLNQFIQQKGLRFIGGKRIGEDGMVYLMKWADGWEPSIVTSSEAISKWPHMLFDFLRNSLNFVKIVAEPQPGRISRRKSVNFNVVSGEPIEIECMFFLLFECLAGLSVLFVNNFFFIFLNTDASDTLSELMYWVAFENGGHKFMDEYKVQEKYPLLAIKYFESKVFAEPVHGRIESQNYLGPQMGKR